MDSSRMFDICCVRDIGKEKLLSFLQRIFSYSKPKSFNTKHNDRAYRYGEAKFSTSYSEEMTSGDDINITITFEMGEIDIYCEKIFEVLHISMLLSESFAGLIYQEIENFIIEEGIMGSEAIAHDSYIQNERFINMLESTGEDTSEYPKCKGTIDEVEIDIEKNPGYYYNVEGFLLGAFYRMWFGKEAYNIYDKEKLRSFSCYENIVMDNDVTRITLYENIADYRRKENRDKQWEFRRELNIDEIGHKMQKEEDEVRKKNLDPAINIKQGTFEHGGIRLIQTYMKDGDNVPRSKADSVEEVELDEYGKEVYRCIKEL